MTLQTLVDNTPPAGTLDLGSKRYDLASPLRVRRAITLTGSGAEIHCAPSTERNWSTVIVQGSNVRLMGAVTVFGSKPVGHGYDPDREAQHGIELRSAVSPRINGWQVENTYGDALTCTRTATGPWCRDVRVMNLVTNEIGRQQVSLDAVHSFLLIGFTFGVGYRSIVDIEPPGGNWGAIYARFQNGVATSNPIGPLLASKGVGHDYSVSGILFQNVVRRNYPIGAVVRPPEGVRRGPFQFIDCSSDTRSEREPFIFNQADGVELTRVTQPVLRGVPPVVANYCTGVDLDSNDFSPTTTPPRIVN